MDFFHHHFRRSRNTWIDRKISNYSTTNIPYVLELILCGTGDAKLYQAMYGPYFGDDFCMYSSESNLNLNDLSIDNYEIKFASIGFYGITQDPETHKYVMVLQYNIHDLDIVHQEFHPGNILSYNFTISIRISDFRLSIKCDEECTKVADVYSFGIIAYEIVKGFPPYPDIPRDKDLAMKICNGLRLKIPFHIPKLITRMIMRCWDARVTHRPTLEELSKNLKKYFIDYRDYFYKGKNKDSEIVIQIKKAEEFSANQESTNTTTTKTTTPLNYQTHPLGLWCDPEERESIRERIICELYHGHRIPSLPQAIYTSRLLNYSNPRMKKGT
ncbi:hypothetical protein Glove_120g63 [Diversispora epigaea]|uniref:Protein kinase domain-containing protein n=1 Tax=Diversispora epigaea TaxID=1348612 RepID=A0A397J630_9GLOM|nr:hypothetical protein Glove_120g63 [Diversispora epigaea]